MAVEEDTTHGAPPIVTPFSLLFVLKSVPAMVRVVPALLEPKGIQFLYMSVFAKWVVG